MARRIRRSRRRIRRRVRGPRRIRMRKSRRTAKRRFMTHRYKRYSEVLVYSNGSTYISGNSTLMGVQYIDSSSVTFAGHPLMPPTLASGGTTGGIINLACNFSADRVTAIGELTPLYDQYRIDGVKIRILPCNNVSTTGLSNLAMPQFRAYHDRDDSDLIATTSDLYQFSERPDVMMGTMARGFKTYIKNPTTKTTLVDRSGVNQGGATIMTRKLIDCNITNIAHYGFKMIIQDVPSPTVVGVLPEQLPYYRIRFTYYMTFTGTR